MCKNNCGNTIQTKYATIGEKWQKYGLQKCVIQITENFDADKLISQF